MKIKEQSNLQQIYHQFKHTRKPRRDVFSKIYQTKEGKKPKFKAGGLVRRSNGNFSYKGYTTNWTYKMYNITEFTNYKIPRYHLKFFSEKFSETWLEKSQLKMEKKNQVMKNLSSIRLSNSRVSRNFYLPSTFKTISKVGQLLRNLELDTKIYMKSDKLCKSQLTDKKGNTFNLSLW